MDPLYPLVTYRINPLAGVETDRYCAHVDCLQLNPHWFLLDAYCFLFVLVSSVVTVKRGGLVTVVVGVGGLTTVVMVVGGLVTVVVVW